MEFVYSIDILFFYGCGKADSKAKTKMKTKAK